MGKISVPSIQNVTDVNDLSRFSSQILDTIVNGINGNIDFVDNIRCDIVTASFGTANVDVTVRHNLRRLAKGYILIQSNVATSLYDGTSPSTTSSIILRSSVIATVTILVL